MADSVLSNGGRAPRAEAVRNARAPPPPLHVALVPRSFARRARSYEDAALAAWEGVQMDNNNEELKAILQKAVALGREEHAQSKATTPPPPPATE